MGFSCYSGYGLTECSPSLSNAELRPDIQCTLEERYKLQAMTGYAFPGCELRVVDAKDNDVPRDGQTMGEIIARSDGVMSGYWSSPKPRQKLCAAGGFTPPTWPSRTNGYIRIVDRKKDIIVSGGENISSLDVEKTLLHIRRLRNGRDSRRRSEMAKLPTVVVTKPGSKVSDVELIDLPRPPSAL